MSLDVRRSKRLAAQKSFRDPTGASTVQPPTIVDDLESALSSQTSEQPAPNQAADSTTQTAKPRPALGFSNSFTPNNPTSAGRASKASTKKISTLSLTRSNSQTPVNTAPVVNQPAMELYLQNELQGSLFCDENFIDKFLTSDIIDIRQTLKKSYKDPFIDQPLPNVSVEKKMYEPILNQLNAILKVTHPRKTTFRFVNKSDTLSQTSVDDAAAAKPDLVLLDARKDHWEHVQVAAEVKSCWNATKLKKGMFQLARYARAMFVNQVHRRHVYGLLFFKWQAMFVRFDRLGVLYSGLVKIDTPRFCEAFAGMMLLSREEFGYDPAFTVVPQAGDRPTQYYVDLPTEAFSANGGSRGVSAQADSSVSQGVRRLLVTERLCHRHSIRGRATSVLVVQELVEKQPAEKSNKGSGQRKGPAAKNETKASDGVQPEPRKYVLKLMWRDIGREVEGEVLKQLAGLHGVAQYMWHGDVYKSCGAESCTGPIGKPCENCPSQKLIRDETPSREGTRVSKILKDVNVPAKVEGRPTPKKGPEHYGGMRLAERSNMRHRRVYCRLLTSSLGEPLSEAKSPRRLLKAILDAILGYWASLNRNIMHRDISEGNVMLLPADASRPPLSGGRNDNVHPDYQESEKQLEQMLAKAQQILAGIQAEGGMLNDFDLHAILDVLFPLIKKTQEMSVGTEDKTSEATPASIDPKQNVGVPKDSHETNDKKAQRIEFRTGTPTFMSIRVMEAGSGTPYRHHFLDDLESFYWLLLWVIVTHSDDENQGATKGAQETINSLDNPDQDMIKSHKGLIFYNSFGQGYNMKKRLDSWGHSWATDEGVQKLILALGKYFSEISSSGVYDYRPEVIFPEVVNMFLSAIPQCAPEFE